MQGGIHHLGPRGCLVFCCLCLVLSQAWLARSEQTRARRQGQELTIETAIFVDDLMFTRFSQMMRDVWAPGGGNLSSEVVSEKLREYVSLLVHQVNERLGTLASSGLRYSISLQVVDIQVNKTILSGSATNEDVLDTFRQWLVDNQLASAYDHAILFTGRDLTQSSNTNERVGGRSYTGNMCSTDGYSVSVINDLGGFQGVYFLAHELAHSLGGGHDGRDNNTCAEDRYILTYDLGAVPETTQNADHPWHFSQCSVKAISDQVDRILKGTTPLPLGSSSSSECLTSKRSDPMSEFTDTKGQQAGQVYPADAQCQMLHGNKSRLCYGAGFPSLDTICTSMDCLDPTFLGTDIRCVKYFAADGTTCGDRKWCKLGMCTSSASAPSIDLSNCPYGDSVKSVNNKDCATAIQEQPALCYNSQVNTLCCKSCRDHRRDSEVCPWGDRKTGCLSTDCFTATGVDNQDCCGTCNKSICDDVEMTDGLTCGVRVLAGGRQACYNSSVARSCCKTCSGYRTSITGCEYGDQYVDETCAGIKDDKNGLCPNLRSRCCRSCISGASSPGRWDLRLVAFWLFFNVSWICIFS